MHKIELESLQEFFRALSPESCQEPCPESFPEVLSSNKKEKETQIEQITNYICQKMDMRIGNLDGDDFGALIQSYQSQYETGILLSISYDKEEGFIRQNSITSTISAQYPLNLISDIFEKNLPIINVEKEGIINALNKVLATISIMEENLIELTYKYGLIDIRDQLDFWGLEKKNSIFLVYQSKLERAIKKLKHPGRTILLKCYLEKPGEPCFIKRETIYPQYLDTVQGALTCQIKKNPKVYYLPHVLYEFYDEDMMSKIKNTINQWCNHSDIPIERLGLSEHAYYALKFAGIKTSKAILKQHGNKYDFSDISSSGLNNVYGMEKEQIAEILHILEQKFLSINVNQVPEIVNYYEKMALKGKEWPDIFCVGLSLDTINNLLKMKYRNLSDVINDYKYGKLASRAYETGLTYATTRKVQEEIMALHEGELAAVRMAPKQYAEQKIRLLSFEKIGIPTRVINAFRLAGINTVPDLLDLIKKGPDKLLEINGIGNESVKIICQTIERVVKLDEKTLKLYSKYLTISGY